MGGGMINPARARQAMSPAPRFYDAVYLACNEKTEHRGRP